MQNICIFISIILFLPLFRMLDLIFEFKWTCKYLGWHNGKGKKWFDGCSIHSVCSKCNKKVMQDSQGNWF